MDESLKNIQFPDDTKSLDGPKIKVEEEFKYSMSYEFQMCTPVSHLPDSSHSEYKIEIGEEFKYSSKILQPYVQLTRLPILCSSVQPKKKSTHSCNKGNNAARVRINNVEEIENNFHVNRDENCKCNICCKIYKNRNSLKSHIRFFHEKAPIFFCDHDHCSFSTKWRTNVINHIKMKHDSSGNLHKNTNQQQLMKTYVCKTCNKYYGSKKSLSAHVRFKHGPNSHFYCDHCGHISKSKSNLVVHIKSKHGTREVVELKTLPKSFKCERCAKSFHLARSLYMHRKYACGEHNFNCKNCDYSCARMGHLNRHMKNIHEKTDSMLKYKCSKCNRMYKCKDSLIRHKRYNCQK